MYLRWSNLITHSYSSRFNGLNNCRCLGLLLILLCGLMFLLLYFSLLTTWLHWFNNLFCWRLLIHLLICHLRLLLLRFWVSVRRGISSLSLSTRPLVRLWGDISDRELGINLLEWGCTSMIKRNQKKELK